MSMTGLEAVQFVKNIADKYSSFKIGKTGDTLENRKKEPNYDDYADLIEVGTHTLKSKVETWERSLIEHFLQDEDYKDKCNNLRGGSGGRMRDSGTYRLYVAVK